MKIDGINLINDSSVTDARIENGNTLPNINSEDEGRMFWLNRSFNDLVAGLYVCDGVKWNYTNDNNSPAYFAANATNMNFTATPNRVIMIDTSQSSVQITLPSEPRVGDYVIVIDASGTFDTNPATVVRNGYPIRGISENLQITIKYAVLNMWFTGSTNTGWTYHNNPSQ